MHQPKILSFFKKSAPQSDDEVSVYSEGDESDDQKDLSEWTRVKAIHSMKTTNIQLFDLRKDVQVDSVGNQIKGHLSTHTSTVVFDPDSYNKKQYNWSLEHHRLSPAELQTYAEMATTIRKRFELAPALLEGMTAETMSAETIKEVQRALRLNRQHTKFQNRLGMKADVPGFETGQRASRKDVSNRRGLDSSELVNIIAAWKTTKCSMRDLAARFKIKATLAHRLTKEYRRDPDFLSRQLAKEQLQMEKEAAIIAAVESLQDSRRDIWTAQ